MFNIRKLFKLESTKPLIISEDGLVREKLCSWSSSLGFNDLSCLLKLLGFKENDVVYCYGDYGNIFRIFYSVNEDKLCMNRYIEFSYLNKEIIHNDGNVCKCYKINKNNDKDLDMNLLYFSKKVNDMIYYCNKVNSRNPLITINNDEYKLSLDFSLKEDCLIEYDKIEEYFVNLKFPIIIENIYNDIKNILNLDESIFSLFQLSVVKKIDGNCNDKTDEILINNGELVLFTKSYDDKRISIDKNYNWVYKKINDNSNLVLKYDNCVEPKFRYRYEDNSKEEDGFFSVLDIVELRTRAQNDMEDIKRLVKRIF